MLYDGSYNIIILILCTSYYAQQILITKLQLYKKKGIELCLVGCNLTTMNVMYFHPKTTPDVPIATAIKASMAIPGISKGQHQKFNVGYET